MNPKANEKVSDHQKLFVENHVLTVVCQIYLYRLTNKQTTNDNKLNETRSEVVLMWQNVLKLLNAKLLNGQRDDGKFLKFQNLRLTNFITIF
jgi:hypothetical protein